MNLPDPKEIENINPSDIPGLLLRLNALQHALALQLAQKAKPALQKNLDNLLTAEQVAKILNVSKGHVYDLARKRVIPFIFVGKKYKRFRSKDIQNLMNGNSYRKLENSLSKM